MKNLLKQEWKFLLIFITALLCLGVGYYEYRQHQNASIQSIVNTEPETIAEAQQQAGVFQSNGDAKEVSDLIQERKQQPPNVIYYTNTQNEADNKAQEIAKTDGADYVLKESPNYNVGNNSGGIITNNYYAISQEKKNKIAAGVTVVDSQVYATVAYQHDKLEVAAHNKDFKSISGATVLYTIKKW